MHMDRELHLSEPFVAFLKAQAGKMGPLGPSLHRRSYARMIDTSEGRVPEKSWSETARRVAHGNVCFVDGWTPSALESEESALRLLLDALILVPAGRHLRQTGAPEGVQFINNCHVSGFSEADPAHHFVFLFNGLMQGGGVGANYSNRFLSRLPVQQSDPAVFYYLDPFHPDYLDIRTAFAEDEIAGRAKGQWIERIDGAYTRYVRVKDSREGWAEALRVLLETHWSPTGDTILFNLSDVRPKGSEIKRFGGTASGPKYLIEMLDRVKSVLVQRPLMQRISSLQAMEIDHAIARCVISGNVRRSARMSIKYWLDEDIFDFIVCKDDEMSHWSTNISIEVDDAFFLALNDPENASHRWAQNVLRTTSEHGLAHGEPGFWNSSLSQIGEPEEVIATNPCVTGDTWITTIEGAKQVRELVGRPFSILTSLGAYPSTQEGFWSTGVRPVLRLTTRRGYSIRCTENHRIRMENGEFREARDIQPGDPIALENCRGVQHTQSERECDLGWLVGSYWGDGSSGGQPRLAFWGDDREERLDAALSILEEHDLLDRAEARGFRPTEKNRPFEKQSARFTRVLESLGALEKDATRASALERSSPSLVRGFLQGLFDTDGSVQGNAQKGVSIRLSQSNEELLRMVQRMLLRFGVLSTLCLNRREEGERTFPDGRGGVKEYTCSADHELIISRKSMEVFEREVGFRREYKRNKLQQHFASRQRPSYGDLFSDEVVRVETLPPEEVFDCTIPGIHVYPSNGFLSHNCGEEVMAAYEACCLGHLNLYRLFLYEGADRDRMIEVCWRYLTRYLLRATEGDTVDEVERAVVDRKRRLGAGFFGFAGMLALLGIPYATCYTYDRVREYLRKWYAVVREEATAYANELNIPSPVKVTTLAPTGTIAKLTESPPSAQALIAREFVLRVRHAKDDPQVQEALEQGLDVEDCIYAPNTAVVCRYMRDPLIEHLYSLGWSEEKVELLVASQDEIPLGQSLQIQAFLQEHWADNAISFTHVLYPGKNLPLLEECIRLLKEALPRLKGTTVMCDAGRPQAPYTKITREEYEARDHRHSVGQAIEDCLNGVCGV